jgi:hypothetical protein
MKTSQSIQNLTKALLVAQTKMGAATKGAKNPFFKSNYADLPTVMEVVKDPLNESGIIVLQPATHRDGKNFITTTLIHGETGEWMESETEVVTAKINDPQSFGAAQTYARRFGLQSMLFIPAEDDDGNFASGRTAPKTYTTPAVNKHIAGPGTNPADLTKVTSIVGSMLPLENTTTVNTIVGANNMTLSAPVTSGLASTTLEPFKKTSSFSKKKKDVTTTVASTTDEY